MSKSRFMKKFLAILVFGFCNLNICASAAMEDEKLEDEELAEAKGQALVATEKTATNFYSSPLEKSSAQESREYIKMKSLIGELARRPLTGNSMCDFVILGKSFLETKEQLEETQNVNQAMENKIRELQIKLDRLIQGIEPSQKEEELKKSLVEKLAQVNQEFIKMKSLVEKLAQVNQEFINMKSRIEELTQESFTGNSMCDFVVLGELFLGKQEQLERMRNENQTMKDKIAELNVNIRELQIELDQSTQGIEPSQKEEELKKSLEKKESGDYNSSREFLAEDYNRKILESFLAPMAPRGKRRVILASSPSDVNILSTLRQIISGVSYTEIRIDALKRENLNLRTENSRLHNVAKIKTDALSIENSNLRTENSCLRNEINELKQKERKLED